MEPINQTDGIITDKLIPKTFSEVITNKTSFEQVGSQAQFSTFRGKGAAVSVHFSPVTKLKNITFYVSDGTTPNGNLGGMIGDVCFGADGGKAYYCTGTTSWVSFT